MYEIRCNSLEQFVDLVEMLVHRGLVFDANADNLKILLTGGY